MNAYKGIRNTHPSLLEMCRSFQGTRKQEIVKIILRTPGDDLHGLRLGAAMGFIGIVIAELLITPTGIGISSPTRLGRRIRGNVRRHRLDHRHLGARIGGLERLERRLFPHEHAAK